MMKNKFTIGGVVAVVGVLSFALYAQAQEVMVTTAAPLQAAVPTSAPVSQNQNGAPSGMARGLGAPNQQGQKPQVMQAKNIAINTGDKKPAFESVINIDAKGHILVRGTLMSVTGTTLTVKAWGITFTVDASKVSKSSAPDTNLASFTIGDFVGVSGVITAEAPQTITAEVVRDRSIVPTKLPKDMKNASSSPERMMGTNGQQGQKPPMMQQGQSQGQKPAMMQGQQAPQGQRPMMGQGQGTTGTRQGAPSGAPMPVQSASVTQ